MNMLNDASKYKQPQKKSPLVAEPDAPRRTIQVPYELHRELRRLSFEQDRPIHEIITSALKALEG